MSKSQDRARAQSGILFRDGGYVSAEDYHKVHPTREMLAERQAKVDKYVAEEVLAKRLSDQHGVLIVKDGKVLDAKDTSAVIAEALPNRYYCTACRKHHVKPSKAWQEHTNFSLVKGGL